MVAVFFAGAFLVLVLVVEVDLATGFVAFLVAESLTPDSLATFARLDLRRLAVAFFRRPFLTAVSSSL